MDDEQKQEETNQSDDQNDLSDDNQPDQSENSELTNLEKKANEYLDGWRRAKADYLNLKKETEKRQAEIIQFSNAALLAELIPIYNNFKLAWQHVPVDQQKEGWVIGFEHIKNQMTDFLKNLGIEEIKTVGEKFNPDIHEALIHEAQEGFESDVVFAEVTPGYTLHGKVLQPAKVKVAK